MATWGEVWRPAPSADALPDCTTDPVRSGGDSAGRSRFARPRDQARESAIPGPGTEDSERMARSQWRRSGRWLVLPARWEWDRIARDCTEVPRNARKLSWRLLLLPPFGIWPTSGSDWAVSRWSGSGSIPRREP